VLEELLIVGEHDELPVGKPVGEQFCEPATVLDVEAVDHVIEQEESDPFVETFGHGEKQRYRE
jgi:hypothetical protein